MSWFGEGDISELLLLLPYDTHERIDVGMGTLFDESVGFYQGMMDFFLNGEVDEETKQKWEQFTGQYWEEGGYSDGTSFFQKTSTNARQNR